MIGLILTLAVIGFILWLIETKIPMDPTIKVIIQVVIAIAVILWLLQAVGVGGGSLPSLKLR